MKHARLFRKLGFALLLSALFLLKDLEILKAKDLIGDGDLTVSNGSWGKVYGMQRQPQTGDAQTEHARLAISGGSVSSSIYGGYARSNDGAARAGQNNVTITGVQGSPGTLYGGYARSASNAVAAANSLTISGSSDLAFSSAYGGRADHDCGSCTTHETLSLLVMRRSASSVNSSSASAVVLADVAKIIVTKQSDRASMICLRPDGQRITL